MVLDGLRPGKKVVGTGGMLKLVVDGKAVAWSLGIVDAAYGLSRLVNNA